MLKYLFISVFLYSVSAAIKKGLSCVQSHLPLPPIPEFIAAFRETRAGGAAAGAADKGPSKDADPPE